MPKKPVRSPQESSKAQQARNPMLAVRLPRRMYRALRKAARDADVPFPHWLRQNFPRLLEPTWEPSPFLTTHATVTQTQRPSGGFDIAVSANPPFASASAGVARHSESESK